MQIVVVTKDPQPFRDVVAKNTPSPMTYNSPKTKAIMDEDAVIQSYRLNVKPENMTVVPVAKAFE
jgi:zinc protease